ncbi:ABC transporter substrate-binding protein [Paenibacillus sp. GYB003]|uniref:ABC transporter substrate-binding protein n=1 Tax=Paenibacillus sp. GYB003 TaxID=2994392 RepID=UPI002F96D0CF
MFKKHVTLSVVLGLLAAAAAGCGGTDKENGAGSGAADAGGGKATDTIDKPVTIDITDAGGTTADQLDALFGNAIRKKFPNVTINYKLTNKEIRLENLITAGENIDIYTRSIGSFFNEVPVFKFQYDLSAMVKTYGLDLNRIEPSLIDSMKNNADGQLWGLPVFNTNLVLYYNKDIFDKFGVAYPKDGMTWPQIYDTAKKLNRTENGVTYVGLALSGQHQIKLNSLGMPYVDAKTGLSTYDDEKWKKIFEPLYVPAEDPGYRSFMAAKGDKVADSQDFYDSKAAMLGTIQHHAGNANFAKAGFNWDMASYPTYPDSPDVGSQSYPTYFAIPSFAKNKDDAFKIIKYLLSDEFQTEASKAGNMTVLKNPDIQKAYGTNAYKGKNLQAAFHNKFAPVMRKTPYDADVEKAATQHIVNLATGKIDINTALRQAKDQADKKIAELKAK